MKHLGDITKINGEEIPPVDVITFGSPCQDLSLAGKRAGLSGGRSGLFMEAIRIIKEMRNATNDEYPKYAVWENVPGAFSSNSGNDFKTVLEELARIKQNDISIPDPDGKWTKSGGVRGNGWSLAWRTMDAQYWGVPQRRLRIALVADFTGQRAGEILFKPESLRGHFAPGVTPWQGTPGTVETSADGNNDDRVLNCESAGIPTQPICLESNQNHATITQTGICPTLSASMGMGGGYIPMITEAKVFDARGNGDGKVTPTITGDHESRVTDYTAITLTGQNIVNTLQARDYKGVGRYDTFGRVIAQHTKHWTIRRLTPLECERLQGFPDNWTYLDEWFDTKGKKHKYADTPRYKALGNSIALPQWFYVLGGIADTLPHNATLGSLFDGIGGFPYVWSKLHNDNKKLCVWASEIEEFPIAVTKKRFPEEQPA